MLGASTVFRAAYSRTFETPFNENLLLPSSSGMGARRMYLEQRPASHPAWFPQSVQIPDSSRSSAPIFSLPAIIFGNTPTMDMDFDVLFNTPITLRIAWQNSKINGVTRPITTTNLHGFEAYLTLGHTPLFPRRKMVA
jgi:hypothetical protein